MSIEEQQASQRPVDGKQPLPKGGSDYGHHHKPPYGHGHGYDHGYGHGHGHYGNPYGGWGSLLPLLTLPLYNTPGPYPYQQPPYTPYPYVQPPYYPPYYGGYPNPIPGVYYANQTGAPGGYPG